MAAPQGKSMTRHCVLKGIVTRPETPTLLMLGGLLGIVFIARRVIVAEGLRWVAAKPGAAEDGKRRRRGTLSVCLARVHRLSAVWGKLSVNRRSIRSPPPPRAVMALWQRNGRDGRSHRRVVGQHRRPGPRH